MWTVKKSLWLVRTICRHEAIVVVESGHQAEKHWKRQHIRIKMAISLRSPTKRAFVVDYSPLLNQEFNPWSKEREGFCRALIWVFIFLVVLWHIYDNLGCIHSIVSVSNGTCTSTCCCQDIHDSKKHISLFTGFLGRRDRFILHTWVREEGLSNFTAVGIRNTIWYGPFHLGFRSPDVSDFHSFH